MRAARTLALGLLALASFAGLQRQDRLDILIFGGRVLDGTGARIHAADIGVRNGRIVEVGDIQTEAKRTIDARGYWVTPGFIDMHSHSDYSLLADPRGLSALYQGVTLVVLGEDMSAGPLLGKARPNPAPYASGVKQDWTTLGEYFDRLESNGIALNVGSYVGSGQVRACVVGYENRRPSAAEMSEMKRLVAQAMDEGALGLSSGLSYVPNSYASSAELIDLARTAAAKGGIYATHLRTSGFDPYAGLRECLQIAEAARIPVEIHHLNSTAGTNIDQFARTINAARKRGLKIEANVYPYTAGMTYLAALLPEWAQEGGGEKMLARLKNSADREKIAAEIRMGAAFNAAVAWDKKVLSSANPALDGKSLAQLSIERQHSPEDILMDVLLEEKGAGMVLIFSNTEEALTKALRLPWVQIGSDGVAISADARDAGRPHPRFFGTFPRVLMRYTRANHLLSSNEYGNSEEMIYEMTLQPAKFLGLKDRGKIAPGMAADLAIFHPEKFRDAATFERPAQYSPGVQWLLVNGALVISDGKYTGAVPGIVIKGPAFRGERNRTDTAR